MQILNPPIYGASRDGLISNLSATFSGDNKIVVPLFGSFQGDPVHAQSLLIDNYNNGIPVAYTVGGLTDYIGAYTKEFIDVSKMDTIMISATDSITINLSLHNTPKSGSSSRGLPPNGISDAMWANVLGLWHFDGNNGSNIGVDSKNPGNYFANNSGAALISTADSLFGGSCALVPGNKTYTEVFSNNTLSNNPYTFEFAVKVITQNAGSNLICDLSETVSARFDNALFFAYRYDAGVSNKLRFELWRETNRINGPASAALVLATPYSYDLNAAWAWHELCLTTLGGFVLYVDGVQAASGGSANPLAGSVDLVFPAPEIDANPSHSFYFDECRLTVGTRYFKNYTPAGQEFPNQ